MLKIRQLSLLIVLYFMLIQGQISGQHYSTQTDQFRGLYPNNQDTRVYSYSEFTGNGYRAFNKKLSVNG